MRIPIGFGYCFICIKTQYSDAYFACQPLADLPPLVGGGNELGCHLMLLTFPHGRAVRAWGLVIHHQRPDAASGVMFVTLEGDTGTVNVIVWLRLAESYRAAVLGARLMTVFGV